MDKLVSINQKWHPTIEKEQRMNIYNFLNNLDFGLGTAMIENYIKFIGKYLDIKKQKRKNLISGLVFFYGSFFYLISFPNSKNNIKNIVLYNVLYILVDHYIDDPNVEKKDKKETIKDMFAILYNPNIILSEEIKEKKPFLLEIQKVYQKLIKTCPKAQKRLIDLFKSEIEGLSIQNSYEKTKEEYLNICKKKGGLTMMVFAGILEIEDEKLLEETYQLGIIMQYIDDSMDVYDDKKENIYTIATYILENEGNLDSLLKKIVKKIEAISDHFKIFHYVYILFANYLVTRYPENFTNSETMEKYKIFDYRQDNDLITFMEKYIDKLLMKI